MRIPLLSCHSQLPKAMSIPPGEAGALIPQETCALQASGWDMAPEGAGIPARFWGTAVGNAHPKHQEQWAARPQLPLMDEDSRGQHPAVPSNICLTLPHRVPIPGTHFPLLLHSPAAAAARGAQAELSAPCPCLRAAWLAHVPTGGTGRRQLGEERFPSPGAHATVTAQMMLRGY